MNQTRAERQRAEIEDQVAAFLASGGEITQLGNTLPKEPEFEMRNGRPRYREARRYAPQARGGMASRRESKKSGPKPKQQVKKPARPAPVRETKPEPKEKPRMRVMAQVIRTEPEKNILDDAVFRGLGFKA